MKTTRLLKTLGGSAAALLVSASLMHAAPITVGNFSFETPNVATFASPIGAPWNPVGFVENAASVGYTAGFVGTQYAGVNGVTAFQDLGVGFLPNSLYTVTLAVGDRGGLGYGEGFTVFGLQSAGVDLGTPRSVDNDVQVADNTFADFTYTFTTGAVAPTGNVVAFFRGVLEPAGNGGNGSSLATVDNYRVDVVAVPEPSTLALGAMGGLGLLALLRRRRA